jgi:hypothetical protein
MPYNPQIHKPIHAENTENERVISNYPSYHYTQGFISPLDDRYASKTYANLIYDEYADYKNRFEPYEQQLLNLADSRKLLDEQLSRITTNVNKSFKNPNFNAGALQQQRYGVSQSAQMQNNNVRKTDLDRALSMAHARNNTRIANSDMRSGLITGSNSVRNDAMRNIEG